MRPKIICHMGSSIDGRLHPSRWTPPAKGIERGLVHRYYDETAARLDAEGWIVGRTTMARSPRDIPAPRRSFPGTSAGPISATGRAVTSPSPSTRMGRSITDSDDAGGDHIVADLGEGVTDAYLTELREDGVSYLFAGPDGRDLAGAMERWARRSACGPCCWRAADHQRRLPQGRADRRGQPARLTGPRRSCGRTHHLRVPRRPGRAARGGQGPPPSPHRDPGRRDRLASLPGGGCGRPGRGRGTPWKSPPTTSTAAFRIPTSRPAPCKPHAVQSRVNRRMN